MMKPKASRLTALLLCLILLFTLGACKGKADEESTEPSANVPAANVENTLPSNEEKRAAGNRRRNGGRQHYGTHAASNRRGWAKGSYQRGKGA